MAMTKEQIKALAREEAGRQLETLKAKGFK